MSKMFRVDVYDWSEPDQDKPDVFTWFTFSPGDKEVKLHHTQQSHYYLNLLPKIGIVGKLGKMYYLKDGMKFMEELKFAFSGSQSRASDVYEI